MSKNIKAGYGYRLLGHDEIICAGDEFISSHTSGAWIEAQSLGAQFKYMRGNYGITAYRRAVDPGSGYRIIAPDETLRPGDEYFDYLSKTWSKSGAAGNNAGLAANEYSNFVCAYRRRVEPVACGHKVNAVETEYEYRLLDANEVLYPGDEYFYDGKWKSTAQPGNIGVRGFMYRRRIEPVACGYNGVNVAPGANEKGSHGMVSKPPIGLKPRARWLEETINQEKVWASDRSRRQEARHGEVVAAIRRYVDANIAVPAEWVQEYFDYLSTRTKIE